MVFWFLLFRLVFDHICLYLIFIYAALTHRDKQQHHFRRDCHSHGLLYYVVLWKYSFIVCVISFGFYSTHYKFYIRLPCINTQQRTTEPVDITRINTQQRTTTPFSSWSPSLRVSLLCWYYENTVLRFVWYRLVFIQLIINFISVYPASTHSNEQQHQSISLT